MCCHAPPLQCTFEDLDRHHKTISSQHWQRLTAGLEQLQQPLRRAHSLLQRWQGSGKHPLLRSFMRAVKSKLDFQELQEVRQTHNHTFTC